MENVKIITGRKLVDKDLENFSKEELIEKIKCLEAHNTQLKNIIAKKNESVKKIRRNQKPFDFEKANYRHVLLKFFYLGWDYHGFATQEDTTNTIEYHIFQALIRTCLIKSRETSNYHRCGRTDKGVSAFSQVISIDIRSKFPIKEQDNNIENELEYCKILNRVLPNNIQCISWSSVKSDFSARFDCKARTYKYFFPAADLNIEAMKTALSYLVGSYDFRNFCKMDVANGVVTFVRNITEASIKKLQSSINNGYEMYELMIKGQAFLWHQIRCIIGILFLIGGNKESPEIVKELLDIEKNPRKPEYNMASEIPLNLYCCEYEEINEWNYDYTELSEVISKLQSMWTVHSVKTTMIKIMVDDLENIYHNKTESNLSYNGLSECLIQGIKPKIYKPLMERQRCEGLEDRIDHFIKKRRLFLHDDDTQEDMEH